jgi:8-oxo-dGTP pyrophosphatase MutT (NUDIX family)
MRLLSPAIRLDDAQPHSVFAADEAPPSRILHGAGLLILYRGHDGDRVLFVRHRDRDTWELPGGEIEHDEQADEAAMREVAEELGATAHGAVSLLIRNMLMGVDYSTFMAHVETQFEPDLSHGDGELSDWVWASPGSPPQPLHPGVRLALDRLHMNELDIARAIASGEFGSPQQYENIWLFALRITGTGVSYRPELEEYVWRPPEIYLNAEFLARCAGLPVIIEHPPTDELNTEEYTNRVIGSIVFAYIEGDEVWGIGKIYDQRAAEVMRSHRLSTSPAVIFRDPSVNETRQLAGGKHLLVEGEPSLLDHLAICELGVWDKDGSPTGIAIGDPEPADGEIELPAPAARTDSVVAHSAPEPRANGPLAWPWLAEVEQLIGPIGRSVDAKSRLRESRSRPD